MPLDLQLEAVEGGDLVIENGAVCIITNRVDRARQRLDLRLSVLRGEYILDTGEGANWPAVLGNRITEARIRQVALDAVLEDPDVATADASVFLETATRRATVSVTARLTTGETLEVPSTVA